MSEHYDVIIVGTGFAGAFFLMRYLEHAKPDVKILVLERGGEDSKAWQLANQRSSSITHDEVYVNKSPPKMWLTSPGFGGNSKCWWAGATRMMPNDFKLQSKYGVGLDWPVSYDDLEAHYCTVEEVMQVSGPPDAPMPRSKPFPLPPHWMSTPDELIKKKFPEGWFHVSTARASVHTPTRAACCATGVCELCPVDAKFTVQNGLAQVYRDPRVTLSLNSAVERVETKANVAEGVVYSKDGKENKATADLVVLAASALFNPHILLRSGIDHPLLGKRLHEQLLVGVSIDLKGVKSYDGSTMICANGYMFYDGDHRRDHAGCMIETWNVPFNFREDTLRPVRGRYTERLFLSFIFDDLPRDDNTVTVHAADPRKAEATFNGYSDYARRGVALLPKMIDKLSEALPIEGYQDHGEPGTAAHIQGTVVMGNDPKDSIVDRNLVHHQLRNLLVLGASAYPTASPAYPSVTVSALSLWAADRLFNKAV